MLWGRYFQEKEAFGKAERREETYASVWECRNPTTGVYERFKAR